MKLFFIRHKPTNLYIQQAGSHKGIGGSLLEPGLEKSARPFHSLRAARSFFGLWLKGEASYDEDSNQTIYTPVRSRHRDDFEIIEKEIDLASPVQTTHSPLPPVPAQRVSHQR